MRPEKYRSKNTAEPRTEVSDNGRYICITVVLPDVREEKIRLDLENNALTITASSEGNLYKKVILVPEYTTLYRKRYHDGQLEITMERLDALTPRSGPGSGVR